MRMEEHPYFVDEWERYKTIHELDCVPEEALKADKAKFSRMMKDRLLYRQIADLWGGEPRGEGAVYVS
jgi:hypothetical protein